MKNDKSTPCKSPEDPSATAGTFSAAVLDHLPSPVIVVQNNGDVAYANMAAEQFFTQSRVLLTRQNLNSLFPADSIIFGLIMQAVEKNQTLIDYDCTVDLSLVGSAFGPQMHHVAVQITPLGNPPAGVIVMINGHSIAQKLDQRAASQNAVRSVAGMAAMLAHELRNPLLSIRGAAELLDAAASENDKALTSLIRDEADRIKKLVDRVEIFTETAPENFAGINIHEVMEHVRKIAMAGFCRDVPIREHYDPSLPPTRGIRDHLIQVLINLLKNAAEAVPAEGGEIKLETSYNPSIRLATGGRDGRAHLPLRVTVQDNGPGIPPDIQPHLFEPFVTTKSGGTGLGLALVAKLISDHGGLIDFETGPQGTAFHLSLPIHRKSI